MTEPNITPSDTPLKENWNDQKTKLIAKISALTGSDFPSESGKLAEMLVKIQAQPGKTREELAAIIAAL